ncbi:MAG TPA: SxtJ family membrane protein [Opitutus sp.]|nr:SxtJ family membrane protein [Opitutus sp.]
MSLIRINTKPSPRDLRVFAVLWLGFLGGFGAIAWHKGAAHAAIGWWTVAGVVSATGLVAPRLVRWVYLAATYAAFPIGLVVSALVLAAFYFLALAPAGVIMRWLGRDPLERRFDPKRATYWESRGPAPAPDSYFRQHP